MNSRNFNYSLKNIPIPDNTSYKLQLIEKIKSFIKRIHWKAHFFLNSEEPKNKETITEDNQNNENNNFGFKTKKTPTPCVELEKFENDLLNLTKNIKFKKTNNKFQNTLKKDVSEIKNNPNILVFADKTNNIYELPKPEHEKLLHDNITKTCKKAPRKLERSINFEAQNIAKKN